MEIGEISTCITAAVLAIAAGIAIGIYITTQISQWIDKKTKK